MDAESLAQIQQIVTTAVSGTENRLRQEMGEQAQALRQEMGEQGQALRSEMKELGGSLRREIAEKFEAAERHAGVLFEEALHRIDLVVEGHQSLRTQISDLDSKIDHVSVELQSLMKLS